MGQSGRKTFVIESFGIPTDLQAKMVAAIASQNRNSIKAPLNKSEWIRRAIERDIAHQKRSNRKADCATIVNNRHVADGLHA